MSHQHKAIKVKEEYSDLVPKLFVSIIVIDNLTVEKQVVFDPFMSTGIFGKAALRMKHQFIGIEIDPQRFELAKTNLRMKIGEGVREINE